MVKRRRLLKEFEKGNLKELLELSSADAQRADVLDLCVWAHSLAGDLARAEWHFRWASEKKVKLRPEAWATIHFALGVANTRISEYARARSHFAKLRRLRRGGFFLWQGLGFYRFFTCRYRRSAAYAERALEAATQMKFRFGQVIAEELLAHAQVEAGEIRKGLRHMRQALARAQALGHASLRQSFRLNLLFYEARFGVNLDCVPLLTRALERLHPNDTYSRNAVKLELASQLTLRGEVRRAFDVLDEACDSIYASGNRRQTAMLNFRLSFLTWLRGHSEEALHLLRSAESQLHRDVDRAHVARMSGLRDRIQGRVRPRPERPRGEDRLGDIYDLVLRKDPRGLELVLEYRLYYFLHAYFDLEPQPRAIYFDLLPNGVIVVDHGSISVITPSLPRVSRRILEALAVSHQTKADLVARVWGYAYDPLRHDSLVYTSISKLRQALGSTGEWIEMDEKGYRLRSGVHLKSPVTATPTASVNIIPATNLSFRQLRILTTFARNERGVVGVDDVMREFQVSRATATRDLAELTTRGYLRRLGRARATRYARTEKEMHG